MVINVSIVDRDDDSQVGFHSCVNLWWLNEHGASSWLIRFAVVEMLGFILQFVVYGFLICRFEIIMGLLVDEARNGSLGFCHGFYLWCEEVVIERAFCCSSWLHCWWLHVWFGWLAIEVLTV